MMEPVRPLEEIDPETGQLFMDVCNGRLNAFVLDTRVFRTTGPGKQKDVRDRIVEEIFYTPGRNDPCSCGSGKKWKKCCGRIS
jgi:hypothetical protein